MSRRRMLPARLCWWVKDSEAEEGTEEAGRTTLTWLEILLTPLTSGPAFQAFWGSGVKRGGSGGEGGCGELVCAAWCRRQEERDQGRKPH